MKANYKNFPEENQITKLAIPELRESYDRNVRDYWTTALLRYTNDRCE